jgi:hypothetical protein
VRAEVLDAARITGGWFALPSDPRATIAAPTRAAAAGAARIA